PHLPHPPIPPIPSPDCNWDTQHSQLKFWRQELPRLMWQSAGISREARSLQDAIEQIKAWRQEFTALPISQLLLSQLQTHSGQSFQLDLPDLVQALRLWGETRNLLDIAYLILNSAILRTESRGGHYRSDYPQPDLNWQAHTLVEGEAWFKSEPVSPE
ncbi:MAG: L-aspartate oxidase, partial [Cyanobacteria bacterium RU_5_0]|nr:L-aspartate oxidase [Cyanobacteria bacterium RU_5_0]